MNPSKRIKVIRIAKRWDQSEVARAVDECSGLFHSASNVCKLEKGVADRASIVVLHALADALEVPRVAIVTDAHDSEIDVDSKAVDFVTRHSLELFATKNAVAPTDAESLRSTYRRIGDGPRDVKTWVMTFAYATAITQARKPGARAVRRPSGAYAMTTQRRKPGARAPSKASAKRRQQHRSR